MRNRLTALAATLAFAVPFAAAGPVGADPAPIERCNSIQFTPGIHEEVCISYKYEYQTNRRYYWGGATVRGFVTPYQTVDVQVDMVTGTQVSAGQRCVGSVTTGTSFYCPAPTVINPPGSPKHTQAWFSNAGWLTSPDLS
jgi:hypothetical protein